MNIVLSLLCLLSSGGFAVGSGLSFTDRVEAQIVIDRLYRQHQLGAGDRFDLGSHESIAAAKVSRYLALSQALEVFWKTPVTSAMLERELERIVEGTMFPDRLETIFDALDRDPVVILETFARPVLVERLARSFFSQDERIQRYPRQRIELLRKDLLTGRIDPRLPHPERRVLEYLRTSTSGRDSDASILSTEQFARLRSGLRTHRGGIGSVEEAPESYTVRVVLHDGQDRVELAAYTVAKSPWDEWRLQLEDGYTPGPVPIAASSDYSLPLIAAPSVSCMADDTWDNGILDDIPVARYHHSAVWTGSLMLVWGGRNGSGQTATTGFRYDPLTDVWSEMSTINAPPGRWNTTAVWTGSEMIVWGGHIGDSSPVLFNSGARYDPVADTWQLVSNINAPSPRMRHTSVWTGTEMVIWGGNGGGVALNSGGRYDPQTDTWQSTSTITAPSVRELHTAVWTGDRMLVWAGSNTNTGGRYDPATDTWDAMTTVNAPTARRRHTAVWTGTEMIVWGGDGDLITGGRYNPATNTWQSTSTVNAPQGRTRATAVWTGARMIVWGGHLSFGPIPLDSGGRYDPATNTWTLTEYFGRPTWRSNHTAVWTGTHMIVWGGNDTFDGRVMTTGSRYDPVTDSWTPTSVTSNNPTPRNAHTAVWTGNTMIVWGGDLYIMPQQAGSQYDPLTDAWSPISSLNAPTGRYLHKALWTDSHMLVWGGYDSSTELNTGGLYDPLTDTWQAMSTDGAPSPGRTHFTLVWTGLEAIVWGGQSAGASWNTGARYDPSNDSWSPVATLDAPQARRHHTAVWTGTRMVVWGGDDGDTVFGEGKRYDPIADTWDAVSPAGAPAARRGHTAVWTGDRMIVWGGSDVDGPFSSGAVYDPSSNAWLPMTLLDSPSARDEHTAVWADGLMVVWGDAGSTGGRYDPATNTWEATSLAGAAEARGSHSAVWTPMGMIVWGGAGPEGTGEDFEYATGGRYIAVPPVDDDFDGFTLCDGDCDDSRSAVYPSAAQVCDGLNNDCNHPSWPALAGTNEMDDDGDALTECSGDCHDGDPGVWSRPGDVEDLAVEQDAMTITWTAVLQPGADDVRYDTIRSGAGSDFVGLASCVEQDDDADTSALDTGAPSAGSVFYYLIRAENDCPGAAGLGPVGNMSNGTPRTARSCP